jgi:hypothetical protein
MTDASAWGWYGLFALGAYHGINPGMGWLFAVALGMQENRVQAVVRSIVPIALGHWLAIAVVVLLAGGLQLLLPLDRVKLAVAGALISLGVYRIIRRRHFRWVGMQVNFFDLTAWSFLMASAHGAGLMILPVVITLPSVHAVSGHAMHAPLSQDPLNAVWGTLVHTAGYLILTLAMAVLVYVKLGLALLRSAWFNLDLAWAVALICSGILAVVI